MAPERVRAATTTLTIILALVVAIALLLLALAAVVVGVPLRVQAWVIPTLILLIVATVAIGAAAVLAGRRIARVEIRTSRDGIEYEAAGLLVRSSWDNCERIGVVPIGIGFGEGIVLRESGLVRSRFAGMQRAVRLDRVIPLSNVMWWWRETELADDLARWAPHFGVARTPKAR